RGLVYDAFGKRTIKRREVFKRQREIALSLPLDRAVQFSEIPDLSPSLAEAFEDAGPRMILRDLKELEKLNLIVREPGLVRANRELLDGTLPQRRKRGISEANRASASAGTTPMTRPSASE